MAGHLVSCVPKTLASIGYSRWPRSGVSSPQPESREGRHAHPPSDRSSKAAQPTEPSDRCAAQRAVQLRHRPLRRARHGRGRARGLRAGGARPHHRRRFPGLHVRERRALLGRSEPGLLQGHRGREGRRRRPRKRPVTARGISRRDFVGGVASAIVAGGCTTVSAPSAAPKGEGAAMFVYVGCYTTKQRNARGEGINVYKMDRASGTWTHVQLVKDLVNPSWLTLDRQQRFLYSAHGDGEVATAF